MSVAARVAQELDVKLGHEVNFHKFYETLFWGGAILLLSFAGRLQHSI